MKQLPHEISQKLSELRLKYTGEDSKELIDRQEKELEALLKDKTDIESSPIFKRFSEILEIRIKEIDALLMNDESLLNEKGKTLLSQKRAFNEIADMFSIKIKDKAIETIVQLIDLKNDE